MQQIESAGPPPVEGADALVEEIRTQVGDLTEDLREARAQLEGVGPNDVAATGEAVAAVGNVLGSLGNSAQAVAELSVDPRLAAAFERAPECGQLAALGDGS